MLQVSPASSAIDLVAPFAGSDDLPVTQPAGLRSFGRVIPADDVQGRAAALWAERLGWRRTALHRDPTPFGESLADAFEDEAQEIGLDVVGAHQDARGGYFAGSPGAFPELQDDLIASSTAGPTRLASDAFLPPHEADVVPGLLGPTYATSAALDPAQLPPGGRDFVRRFESEYGRAPGRYAAYGYEAMAVILDSIERAADPTDRTAVINAFFETAERDSVLGSYSIDAVGDTTLDRLTGYELRGSRAQPVIELRVAP
jgi:branched-chain amino acid transport system substrate-binding protein